MRWEFTHLFVFGLFCSLSCCLSGYCPIAMWVLLSD
nr:MAG TPA: hypothetical protein [Caudoviricetes sp.]